jgi:hypothetical protein
VPSLSKRFYTRVEFKPDTKIDILKHMFFGDTSPLILKDCYYLQIYFFSGTESIEFYSDYKFVIHQRVGEVFSLNDA